MVDVTSLRVDQFRHDEHAVAVRFADDWIEVPDPFAELIRHYLGQRPNMATAANPTSPWLFPGRHPGAHLGRRCVADELKRYGVGALALRNSAWGQMTRTTPPALLAQALGVSITTANRHAAEAGTDWMAYVTTKRS